MTNNSKERRNYPRAAVDLHVEYKKLNIFFHDYTRNISKGGTFIRTPHPLDIGTEFVFKLSIPDLMEPLSIRGRVQWIVNEEDVGKDPDRPEVGMGIKFLYDSDEDRLSVESTVERLMKKHLGELAFAKLMKQS